MFLRYVFFICLGITKAQGDEVFARVGDNFAFTFTSLGESDVCSISKGNKLLLHYGSNRSITIEPEYKGRVVNETQSGLESDRQTLHFSLINLTEDDSGEYTDNCTDSTQTKTSLKVIYPITRVTIKQTGSGPAVVGYNFSLFCNVTPPIHVINVTWSFTNTLMNVENENIQLLGEHGKTLFIQHVKESDTNARIVCFATDVLNETKSSDNYTLLVVVPPEVLLNAKIARALIGRPFFTDCGVKGYPSPEVWWYKKGKRVPQFHVSDSVSTLVVKNVTSLSSVNYTCSAKVSMGSFCLSSNESFILQPYGLSVADQQFLDSDAYKYTMFGLSILGATCLVLILLTIVLRIPTKVRGDSSNKYGVLPETLEAELVQEEKTTTESSAEKTNFDEGNSRIIFKETNLKSPRPDDGPPQQGLSMYEDIAEDFKSIPKLPTKTSEMKKVRSEPIIPAKKTDKYTCEKRDRSKKPKNLPNDYSDLRPKTGGESGLYEEMALDRPSIKESKEPIQETYANTATVVRELGSERL